MQNGTYWGTNIAHELGHHLVDEYKLKVDIQGGAPPVISWFIIPLNYRYNLLVNPRIIGLIDSPT